MSIFASLAVLAITVTAQASPPSFQAELNKRFADPRVRYIFKHLGAGRSLLNTISGQLTCEDLAKGRPLALVQEFNNERQWNSFRQSLLKRIDVVIMELDRIASHDKTISPRLLLNQLVLRHLSVRKTEGLLSRWQTRLGLKVPLVFLGGPDPRYSYEPVPEISSIASDVRASYGRLKQALRTLESPPNEDRRVAIRYGAALDGALSAFHELLEYSTHFEKAVQIERRYLGQETYRTEEREVQNYAQLVRDFLLPRWLAATEHLRQTGTRTSLGRSPTPERKYLEELSRIAEARVVLVTDERELNRFAEQLLRDFEFRTAIKN